MRFLRSLTWHPFLFAVYQVLFLFANNTDTASPAAALRAMSAILILLVCLILLLRKILKDSLKACIFASVFVMMLFSFQPVMLSVNGLKLCGFQFGRLSYVLPLWAVLTLVAPVLVIRLRTDMQSLSRFLNTVAIILICMCAVRIGVGELQWQQQGGLSREWESVVSAERKNAQKFSAGNAEPKRDIYYIILDQYPREDVLKYYYHYDNSEFIKFLTDRGFYVCSRGRSNYPQTFRSLPSSLNLDQLDHIAARMHTKRINNRLLRDMVRDNIVARILKDNGYLYICFLSGFDVTHSSPYADINVSRGWKDPTEFDRVLIDNTVLQPVGLADATAASYRMFQFDQLGGIPEIKKPTFTFAHIVCPHPPYVFDRNGVRPWLLSRYIGGNEDQKFLDQMIYISKLTEVAIDKILATSDVPPIIIVQADHGPQGPGMTWSLAKEKGKTTVDIRTGILNAYHFPGKHNSGLYPSITPVNSFRVMFNNYFGAHYKMIEDTVHFPVDRNAWDAGYDPDRLAVLRGLDDAQRNH